jgi:uncharacterized membrane protein
MGTLHEAKMFGGVGAILTLVGGFIPIPWVGPILRIVGLILVIIAVKYIADVTKDKSIFKNYLINFICGIIAIIAATAIIVGTIGAVGGLSFFNELEDEEITDFESFWDYFEEFIVGVVAALVIGWVLLVIGAFYLRKSYHSIANHTNVDLFRTTGTVYLIGAITLIILIGVIILIIAAILEIASYFSLPDELPTKEAVPASEK